VRKPKLPALTTLRFIAAALVVTTHADPLFDLTGPSMHPALEQAVCFFFTLSGFILAYNYPTLDVLGRRRFLVARVARMYPVHVAALIVFVLVSHADPPTTVYKITRTPLTLLANLAMVHSWIPLQRFNLSFNAASWSISTEFFFYFWFIAMVPIWRRTWRLQVAFSALLAVALIALAVVFHLPGDSLQNTPSISSVLYAHPFARLLDFVLGMVAAHALRVWGSKVRVGLGAATAIEATALVVPAAILMAPERILGFLWISLTSRPLPTGDSWVLIPATWLHHDLNVVPFAFLIFVMALQRGLVSRALAFPVFVLLGEMSYSLYLLHPSVLALYEAHAPTFYALPSRLVYAGVWCVLLLTAYVSWATLEVRGRAWMVRWGERLVLSTAPASATAPAVAATRRPPTTRVPLTVPTGARTAAAAVGLASLLALCIAWSRMNAIDAASAADFSRVAMEGTDGVSFGGRFLLHGARLQRGPRGAQLDLVWESQGTERLDWKVAVHCVDASGRIVAQADYPQDPEQRAVERGAFWKDVARIPDSKLAPPVSAVAIAIYRGTGPSGEMLVADRGPRDWDNHRIVLSLSPAVAP
jgi:peptidoglycan/LPS O-acetylase OafA/YrhL